MAEGIQCLGVGGWGGGGGWGVSCWGVSREARCYRPAKAQPNEESRHMDWLFVDTLHPTEHLAEYNQLEL